MGKSVDSPRYNVITTRLDDRQYDALFTAARELAVSLADFARVAILERIDRVRES